MGNFLDAAKELVAETSEKLSVKFAELSGTAKLRSEIKEAQDMVSLLYMEIGKRHYEERTGALSEADLKDFSIIDDKLKKVEELKRALAKSSVCPACGATVKDGQKFCSECGLAQGAENKRDHEEVEQVVKDDEIVLEVSGVVEDEDFVQKPDLDSSSYGEEEDPFEGEGIFQKCDGSKNI